VEAVHGDDTFHSRRAAVPWASGPQHPSAFLCQLLEHRNVFCGVCSVTVFEFPNSGSSSGSSSGRCCQLCRVECCVVCVWGVTGRKCRRRRSHVVWRRRSGLCAQLRLCVRRLRSESAVRRAQLRLRLRLRVGDSEGRCVSEYSPWNVEGSAQQQLSI